MKNIHILPTDKPSRLWAIVGSKKNTEEYVFGEHYMPSTIIGFRSSNMYITSDEYIGLSYYLDGSLVRKGVVDDKDYWEVRKDYKKIILTTDQDLIKDDVQTIDDDFLEWFVKNPSCEEVETERLEDGKYVDRFADGSVVEGVYENYKIIIPKEEKDYTALLQPVGTKQTAVEWLYKNLKSHFKHDGDLLEVVQFSFEQAKEMEREQLNERYLKGIEVYNTKFKNK